MWNSVFVKLHNHSRIKSFLQSIYLKSSVHRLWIWQRIFPQSRFDFIPGNRYKNLAHSQQGSLFTLSFSFKTCDKYQIAHVHRKADGAAAHTALPPGVTRPPRCAPAFPAEPRARQGFPLQPSRSWAGEQAAQAYGHVTIYSKYTTSCLKAMILAVMFILGIKGKSCKALGGLLPAEPPASPSSGPLTKALSWKTQNTFIYLSIYLLKKKVWYIKI